MSTVDVIRKVAEKYAPDCDLEIFDVEFAGGVLRITADRINKADPKAGTDIAMLQKLSRSVGHEIEEDELITASYTLEVSSPGVERKLRTPEHFQRSVGETIKLKTFPGGEGDRRAEGELIAATDIGIEVRVTETDTVRSLTYGEISSASTVFAWGGAEKPGQKNKNNKNKKKNNKQSASADSDQEKKETAS